MSPRMSTSKLYEIIYLIRPHQWYKNLLVFLALLFSQNLMNQDLAMQSMLAFVAFCLMSSANYVVNDLFDSSRDRLNPEKRRRPIASKKISRMEASAIASGLFMLSLGFAALNSSLLVVVLLLFFGLTLSYSSYIKHIPFVELFFVAINFVVRAVGGAVAISVYISPWLIIGTFFLALFVIIGKRKAEFGLTSCKRFRRVMCSYSSKMLSYGAYAVLAVLVCCYTLYTIFVFRRLVVTIPLFVLILSLYTYHIIKEDKLARHPHLMVTDFYFVSAVMLTLISITILLYLS